MGRRVVDPVDLDHTGNPAVTPRRFGSIWPNRFGKRNMIFATCWPIRAAPVPTPVRSTCLDRAAAWPATGTPLRSRLGSRARSARHGAREHRRPRSARSPESWRPPVPAAAPAVEEWSQRRTSPCSRPRETPPTPRRRYTRRRSALPARQETAATLVATTTTKDGQAAARFPNDKEVADAAAKLKPVVINWPAKSPPRKDDCRRSRECESEPRTLWPRAQADVAADRGPARAIASPRRPNWSRAPVGRQSRPRRVVPHWPPRVARLDDSPRLIALFQALADVDTRAPRPPRRMPSWRRHGRPSLASRPRPNDCKLLSPLRATVGNRHRGLTRRGGQRATRSAVEP